MTRIIRSPATPISGSPVYSPDDLPVYRGGGSGFSPLDLPGLVGYYDITASGVLFEDTAGSTPADAATDPIGRVDAVGPDGAPSALQGTATARPLYQVSPARAEFDLLDDSWSWTLPAISGGQVVIAGPAGIWIDDLDFAGGTWTLGPSGYTGGPEGLLSQLGGDITHVAFIDTAMDSGTRDKLVAYLVGKGGAGLITNGSQLVTNGDFASAAGWTLLGAATIAGGVGTTTSGGGWRTSVSLTAGKHYLVEFDVVRYVGGNVTPAFTGGTTVFGGSIAALGKYREIMTAATGNTRLQISTGGGSNLDIDNVSVREVIMP